MIVFPWSGPVPSYTLVQYYQNWLDRKDTQPGIYSSSQTEIQGVRRLTQGSYRQDCVKFRTFQGLLKDFPTVYKD